MATGDIHDPEGDLSGAGAVEYRPADALPSGDIARYEQQLMAVPGVTFVGVGERGLVVGVLDASVANRLPDALNGVPITVTVTGPVDALAASTEDKSGR